MSIEELRVQIAELNPMQAGPAAQQLALLTEEERASLKGYIQYCTQAQGMSLRALAESYDLLVRDAIAQFFHFREHGKYQYESAAAVTAVLDPHYMHQYMHGLALSLFLWPNHRAMRRFFLESLPSVPGGAYLEIGPGHGFYLMDAMRRGACAHYLGVDLNAASVQQTRDILGSGLFGDFGGYEVRQGDFLEWQPEAEFDVVVAGEVLEHVDEPEAFLRGIYRATRPGGHIFVTTCMNAPMIDHVYLYRTFDEVLRQVDLVGLKVRDQLLLPYPGKTLEQAERESLTVNVALALTRE